MNTPDEFFRPEEVDEQIERLRRQSPGAQADAELIAYLSRSYAMDTAQERETLRRMWARISEAAPGVEQQRTRKGTIISMQERQTLRSSSHTPRSPRGQRLGIVAAVLFLAILVGSMAFVFNAARHTTTTGSPLGGGEKPRPTPTVAPSPTPGPKNVGKVVYSTHVSVEDGTDAFALNWSPDSKRLGIGTLRAQSWDATSGKNVVNYGPLRSGSIMDIAFSPDGKRVAVTSVGAGVQIYDATTGQLLMTYTGNSQARIQTGGGGPLAMLNIPGSGGSGSGVTAWCPDGSLMATSFFSPDSNYIQVWNTATGKMLLQYNGHHDFIQSISWSPDSKYIVSTSVDGSIQLWSVRTGQKVLDIEEHARNVITAAFSPDGQRIAYTDNDAVKIIDAQTGKLLLTHNGPNDRFGLTVLSWSPDGSSIASAGDHIELWNTATDKTYYTFKKNPSTIRLLAWSPDGKYIASADSPETTPTTIQVWIA